MRLILYTILLMHIASIGAQETNWGDTFEIERFSWIGSVPVEAGRCDCNISVLNNFGTVRARFGGYKDRVEVFANIQHFAEEEPRLVVETRESPAGVQVVVGYPDDDSGELLTVRTDQKKRADLVVWVPHGAPLSVSTDQGLVDIRGLESDVQVQTSSGNITTIKVKGNLNFETSSGDIVTSLEHWEMGYEHTFTSESGEQSIYFSGDADARIEISTSGLISTDYSMNVDYVAREQPVRRAHVKIGEGLSTVSLSSTNGRIRLGRRPLASQAQIQSDTKE